MCKRDLNKRTNLGNMYLENMYIITVKSIKLNVTWFTKKKGINCGILYVLYFCTIFYCTFELTVP
jgi:hypothetical protein